MAQSMNEQTINWQSVGEETMGRVRDLEADVQSPLFTIITEVLKEHDPQATALPFLLIGGTDARHVTRLGTKVYGFVPGLYAGAGEGRRVHSHDERVSLRSLQWGVRVLYEVVARFAGSSETEAG